MSCCSMHGAKKYIRYFCWCLFDVTLAHGYFQASSESSDDQMPPAVAGATLSKTSRNPHVQGIKSGIFNYTYYYYFFPSFSVTHKA